MNNITKKQPSNKARLMPKCPICGAPADLKLRPFCSPRCSDIDLGHWIQGKYAIPAVDAADDTIVEALLTCDNLVMQEDDNR